MGSGDRTGGLLDALFASPSAALCLLDADLRILRVTHSWLSSAGLESPLRERSLAVLTPERASSLAAACAAPIGTQTELASRVDPTGGGWSETATTVPLEDGRVGILLEASVPVHSAPAAALHEAIDSVPFGILVIEHVPPDGIRLIATNPEHRRVLGMMETPGASEPPYVLFRADRVTQIPIEEWPGPSAVRTGVAVRDQIVHARRSDGTWRVIEASAIPLAGDVERRRAVVVTLDVTQRWEAQEALTRSEHTFRAAFQNVEDGVALIHAQRDAEGKVVDFVAGTMNDAAARLLGSTVEELHGRPVGSVLDPVRARMLDELLRGVLATGEPAIHERKIGAREYLFKTCRIGEDVLERVAIDVTELRRNEGLTREHAERLRQLVEHTPAAVAMFDREMRYIAVSKRFLEDYRLPASDVLGRSHYELFPDLSEQRREIHRRCLAGATERALEEPFTHKDGSVDWVDWEIRPWYAADGTIGGIVSISVLANERRAAAERLRAEKDRLAVTLGSIGDAVIATASDGSISLMNGVAERLTGWTTEQALGRPVRSVVELLGEGVSGQELRDALVDGGDRLLVARDGSSRPVSVSAAPICARDGALAGTVLVLRDLTQLRRMQAQLMQSDRLATLGTLAAGIAHEINNPLAYLTSALELVAEYLAGDVASAPASTLSELRDAVADARGGARRVRAIVNDLKAFSRPEREETTALDLPSLMDSAIAMAGNELRHRATVVRRYGDVPAVLGNEARVGQVFLNLLVNAAQATPEGRGSESEIEVSLGTDERGHALVEVRDHGPGMPPEHLGRVFDPFFTTKRGTGTGLGLAICRDTVHHLRGEITIESGVGMGTVVRVTLPPGATAPRPSGARPVESVAWESARQVARVLVVDDEAPVCKSLKRLLKEHDVVTETTGRAALERLQRGERFDVVLCDMMLLDMNGVEVHAEMVRIAPDQAARMVFVTGGAFTPQTAQFLERGTLEVVHKPFSAEEVRAVVQRIAARRDQRGVPAA